MARIFNIDQFYQVIFVVTGASVDKAEHNIETMQHNNFISLYFPVLEGFTHIKNDHLIYMVYMIYINIHNCQITIKNLTQGVGWNQHSSTLVTMVIRGSYIIRFSNTVFKFSIVLKTIGRLADLPG